MRERLGGSTRIRHADDDDDVVRRDERRRDAGKHSSLEADSDTPGEPGKLTRLATDPFALTPAAALRYARAIDRKADGGDADVDGGALASAFAFLEQVSGGQPLPEALRRRLDRELRADLSGLRVHTGPDAARAAAALHARAFTVGSDVYFAGGAYDPTNDAGVELIAHEAAHVARGRGGSRGAGVSRPDDTHEREADAFARAFVRDDAIGAVLRGELVTIAEILALDGAELDVVVGALPGARGKQVGSTVYLDPAALARGVDDARYLIAHELVHAAQRALPVRTELDHGAAEAEAAALGRAYAHGHGLARPHVGLPATEVAFDDGTSPDAKLLASPPPLIRAVQLFQIRYRPATESKWIAGMDKKRQALAAVLQDLVGKSAYTVALLDEVIAASGGEGNITVSGPLDGKAVQDETVKEFTVVGTFALDLVKVLTDKGLKVSLSKENLESLQAGVDGADTWEDLKTFLFPWVTYPLYTGLAAFTAKTALQRYGKAFHADQKASTPATKKELIAARHAILEVIGPPIETMEAVRSDALLVNEPAYRALWDLPAAADTKGADVAIAGEDHQPSLQHGFYFLSDQMVDKELAKEARKSHDARKKVLDRFATRLSLRKLAGDGDAVLADGVAKPQRPPLGSILSTYPQLEPPFFDTPKGGDREFVMEVQWTDFFEAFRGYVYKWELIHVPDDAIEKLNETADDMSQHGTSPGQFDVLGGRLSRDVEYGSADIRRAIGSLRATLGEPGIGAVSLAAVGAALRMVGTVIKTFIETLFKPRYEKTMPFKNDGLYVVRCIAWPQPSDKSVIDRSPSVAWLPIWVRPARDMSKLRANLDDKIRLGGVERVKEIDTQLADPNLPKDQRDALLAEKQQIETSLHGKGDDLLAMERKQLDAALATETDKFRRDQIKKRLDEIDEIQGQRKDRIKGAKTDGSLEGLTRIPAAFVGDQAQSIRPLFETYQKPNSGTSLVYHAIDSTTHNSGHQDGQGDNREDAIAKAIQNILESDQGYGRGYVTITIPAAPGTPGAQPVQRTIRIEKSLGGILEEALDNLATVAAIAAIAAAPFTGGASLALLVPIGIVGAIPSAYRLIDRASQGTLRFDMAAAMDVVNILGAAVGAGQASAAGKAALRGVQVGRGWMILGLGTDGLGMLVAGAGVLDQINELSKDPNMPPGLRNAAIAQIVGNQLVQIGMAVGAQLSAHGKAQQEALGGKKPVEVTHAPIEPQIQEKFRAEVGPKGGDITVFRDADGKQVTGAGVEVHYQKDGYGLPSDIKVIAGPGASEKEILAHAKTAKAMLEYQGLVGYLRNLLDRLVLSFKGKPAPKSGSRAWEAKLELEKLPDLVFKVYEDLKAGKITPDAAASKMKDLQAQMMRYEQALNEIGEGKGFIAAHDDVTKAALAQGYPAVPTDHFYFETPEGTFQLQCAVDSTAPRKHVENHGGKWVVVDGPAPTAVGGDVTALRKNLAGRLGVAGDKVTLHGDATAADPVVKPTADGGFEIHYKKGTPDDVILAAADQAKEAGASDRWLLDLKNQLPADQKHRLELMTKGKTPDEIFVMFSGDIDVALAKVGGSNLPNDLIQLRQTLGEKATRAFDFKWSRIAGGDRAPSAEKIKSFRDFLAGMEKRGGSLEKGLEAHVKIPAGEKVHEPKANPYPENWNNFDEANNEAFKERLEKFRGTDDLDNSFGGGEGRVYPDESRTKALKRWFKKRLKDFAGSIKKLQEIKAVVDANPELAKVVEVVSIYEVGMDWIVRDFIGDSDAIGHMPASETARKAAIAAIDASKPAAGSIADQLRKKLDLKSDNLHWSPGRGKIIVIDMQ